jgi:prolyl oligopeptidase
MIHPPQLLSEVAHMRSSATGLAVIAFAIVATTAAYAAPGHSSTASTSAHPVDRPPVAPREPVVDDYFGTKITDDYRWMEDRRAPRFEQWCRKESRYARTVLDRIPGRDSLQQRIAAHTGGGTLAIQVHQAGGKVFYLKLEPGQDTYKLFVRDGTDGAESLLVDPDRGATPGHHFAIDYFEPSPDGSRIAYGISPGGSEKSVIHVLDVAPRREWPEIIDRADYGSPSWRADNRSFYYNRFAKVGPDSKDTEQYLNSRACLHMMGTDPDSDRALIGTGVPGSLPVTPVDYPFIHCTSGSPYVIATISPGADPAVTAYVARSDASGRLSPWVKIADVDDAVTTIVPHGDKLYLLTHKNAPRYQVIAVDAAAPDLAKAATVVAPSEGVIQEIDASSGALYVRDLDGGLGRLRRYDFASGRLEDVALPVQGALYGPYLDPKSSVILAGMVSWLSPPAYYRLDGPITARTSIVPPWKEDLSPYEVDEVNVPSWDGTLIPLSIVHRRDIRLDGTSPVWLTGYGAYGISITPSFVTRFLTLLEDGGVYAVAHVRGGGEFGEEWHLAGKQATKPNTYKDLIACAEYLVKQGYGSPATLAIEGRSAGGITVGMATTARPDLFRVVFNGVGDNNALRCEYGTDGPANSLEYGSTRTEAGFRALYSVDATQHVEPGTAYPAVLLTSGFNDPRVAPWQPGKMAARLQAATTSGRPILFLVDFDAGHGMGSSKSQRDRELADQLAFLYWQIGKPGYRPPTAR